MRTLTKLVFGMAALTSLLAAKPVRGLESNYTPPAIVEEQEQTFDCFRPLTLSLFPSYVDFEPVEVKNGITFHLNPIRHTKNGLPYLGGTQKIVKGSFALSPTTAFTAEARFSERRNQEPSMVEMLKAKLGFTPDPENYFKRFGDTLNDSETNLDEIMFGLNQRKNYFELRQGEDSAGFRANFGERYGFNLVQSGETRTLEGVIGALKLKSANSPNSSSHEVDFPWNGYAVRYMQSDTTQQFRMQSSNSLFSCTDNNGETNIAAKRGPYSFFQNGEERIILYIPEGFQVKVVDAIYGTDVEYENEGLRVEHLAQQNSNLVQYRLNRNFAMALLQDENGARPEHIVVSAPLGDWSIRGFNLGGANASTEFDGNSIYGGLDLGNPREPFFMKFRYAPQISFLLNWKDPNNPRNGAYVDIKGDETVAWATFYREF